MATEYAEGQGLKHMKMMALDINKSGPVYSNNQSTISRELLLEEYNAQEVRNLFPVIFFYAIVLLIGVVGNILVLLVYSFRYKRSPARLYILFLATIDFSICVFGLPYHLIDLTHPYTFTNSVACKSLTFIVTTLFHMSIFGLIVIAVDRYLKICRPLGKLQISYFGRRRACVAAIIAAVALSWPQIVLYGPSEMEPPVGNITGYACFIETSYFETQYPFIYIMVTLIVCVGSTIFLILAYSLICRQIYLRYKDTMVQIRTSAQALDEASMTDEMSLKSYTLPINGKHTLNRSPLAQSMESQFKEVDENICTNDTMNSHSNINIFINPANQNGDVNGSSFDANNYQIKSNNNLNATDEELCELLPTKPDNQTDESSDRLHVMRQRSFSLDSYEFKTPLKPEDTYVYLENKDQYYVTPKPETQENCDGKKSENLEPGSNVDNCPGKRNSTSSQSFGRSSNNSSTSELCLNDQLMKCTDENVKGHTRSNRLELPRNRFGSLLARRDDFKRRYSEQFGNKNYVNRRHNRSGSMGIGALVSTTHYGDGLRIHTCTVNRSDSLANSSQSTVKPSKSVSRKHSKITKIMFTITTIFILSYVPALVITIYSFVRPEIWDLMSIEETVICEFFLRFYLINNVCNPFIYGFWDKRFKREILITLKKLFRFRGPCESCYGGVSFDSLWRTNVK